MDSRDFELNFFFFSFFVFVCGDERERGGSLSVVVERLYDVTRGLLLTPPHLTNRYIPFLSANLPRHVILFFSFSFYFTSTRLLFKRLTRRHSHVTAENTR